MITAALAYLAVASSQVPSPPKVDLWLTVSHDPSRVETDLKSVSLDKLPEEAAKAGYKIWKRDKTIVLWDENFMDMKAIELCMEGHRFLASLLRSGKLTFRMGDLTAAQKAGVRQVFIQNHLDKTLGPNVWNDDLTVGLGMYYQTELENDGKTANGWLSETLVDIPSQAHTGPSLDEISKFVKDDLPNLSKEVNISKMSFSYNVSTFATGRDRLGILTDFLSYIDEELRRQTEEYEKGLIQLENAYSSANEFKPGVKFAAVNKDKFRGMSDSGYEDLGFKSQGEARSFLDNARVKSVRKCVTLEVRVKGLGGGSGVTFSTWVRRKG